MGIRYSDSKSLSKTMNSLVSRGITVSKDPPKAFNKTLNYSGLAKTSLFDKEVTKYALREKETPKSITRIAAPKLSRPAETSYLWKKIMHPVLSTSKK